MKENIGKYTSILARIRKLHYKFLSFHHNNSYKHTIYICISTELSVDLNIKKSSMLNIYSLNNKYLCKYEYINVITDLLIAEFKVVITFVWFNGFQCCSRLPTDDFANVT